MSKFAGDTGFAQMFATPGGWKTLVMLVISCFLLYLAIVKKYEPLLLLPIAFGMLLTNFPGANLFHTELWND
ncbi:MAG: sodium ion-translocating decarboxylase subunit beta, partial [Bacteroidales bacterium]|nr:sodium ion-translocating decarboxylase subunit beta [Bacteroidales bacterium]